ncbi:hypothetical protein AB0P21_04130 [Kribbella sp. NPDC056861]|uniref:hypothetical protein n=1 Tax=Kribbella sp. NPDC056861 TaxID=3154857 RepID=UPI0034382A8D
MNDDELLARLKAADPASRSDAPEPDIDRLLEASMTTDTETRPTTAGARRRWLPAAAAGVLIATGGLVWGLTSGQGGDTPPVAGPPATSTTPSTPPGIAKAVLKLTVGGGASGKCKAVEVADLRRMQTAFEGTATAVKGELVTLRVDHWYRGGEATTVEVRSDADAVATLLGVEFKVGGTYLVSAIDAQVSICGESGPATPELRALYQQAF